MKRDRTVNPNDGLTNRLNRTDPVRALVDEAVAQPTKRQERRPTPRAIEPVEQIDPTRKLHWVNAKALSKGKGVERGGSSNDSSSSSSSSDCPWLRRQIGETDLNMPLEVLCTSAAVVLLPVESLDSLYLLLYYN